MPDLSGDLATFALPQILTLLEEARKTGELRVAMGSETGRVFLDGGQVVYATVRGGTDAVHEVDALMDLYAEDTDGDEGTDDRPALSPEDALMEQITEVFFTLTQLESGLFDFAEEAVVAPYNADGGYTFSISEILARVDDRIEQWRKIGEVVPSIHEPYRLAPQLPKGLFDVTLDGRTFRYVAALGGGQSVVAVAETLRVSEFIAAKKLADLVKQGLVELVDQEQPELLMTEEPSSGYEDNSTRVDHVEEATGVYPTMEAKTFEGSDLPRVQPTAEPVKFETADLSRDEINEKIRNFSRGIYSGD